MSVFQSFHADKLDLYLIVSLFFMIRTLVSPLIKVNFWRVLVTNFGVRRDCGKIGISLSMDEVSVDSISHILLLLFIWL